jgi:putative ABC transport system permease protein
LVRVTVAVLGRFRSLPPILKTAVAYPMQNRFRTGMTLAMFSLVVFTLVCMSFIIAGIGGIYGDTVKLAGGFDVRASTSYANPVADLQTSVSEALAAAPADPVVSPLAAITSVGTVTGAMVEARDARSTAEPTRLLAQGIDADYAQTITYDFALKAPEFTSARQVWQTLQSDPNTVVVSSTLVPSRANYSMGAPAPPFQLQGFYLQDGTLPDVAVEIRDPAGGTPRRLRVIGVLSSTAFYAGQLMTSSSTLADLYAPQPVPPIMQFLTLKAGSDPVAVSKALEKRFLINGMQAESMAAEIRKNAQATIMINTLLQGFMALGLVVGIASLGVVAARAVVERRKEIGVLRAIGFQKGMVQSAFLLESSFVALLGIGMGVVLGFGVAPSIISSMKEEVEGLQFTVPWKQLLVVIVVAYVASLVTTYLPARQAARVYPAEALRYE